MERYYYVESADSLHIENAIATNGGCACVRRHSEHKTRRSAMKEMRKLQAEARRNGWSLEFWVATATENGVK